MISVTKLLFARDYFGDRLRYTKNAHTMRNGAAEGVGNRPQVARGVIDDGYHRTPLLLGTV